MFPFILLKRPANVWNACWLVVGFFFRPRFAINEEQIVKLCFIGVIHIIHLQVGVVWPSLEVSSQEPGVCGSDTSS